MSVPIRQAIEICNEFDIPYLVIGGFAVIAHGYARDTIDLDLVASEDDRTEWRERLGSQGYQLKTDHPVFDQFAPPTGLPDLDIMFLAEETFRQMHDSRVELDLGQGVKSATLTLEHLLALKLHAVKNCHQIRKLKDLNDIIMLVDANRVDVADDKWRKFFLKYGTEELYETIERTTRRD